MSKYNSGVYMCEVCGKYYDELIIARLKLVTGQIETRYICSYCMCKIKNIIKKELIT